MPNQLTPDPFAERLREQHAATLQRRRDFHDAAHAFDDDQEPDVTILAAIMIGATDPGIARSIREIWAADFERITGRAAHLRAMLRLFRFV